MKRRNFLIGAGSAAIGGSALLGSGAFSRVESHRSMTVQIANDPNAYLGMDDCMDSDGNETPNSSFAKLDEFGHLEVDMTPSNPTSPGGEGVNSDSITWADNVFQICNQGKEEVCLWISEKTGDDPDRVTLYVDADARGGTSETPQRLTDDDPRTREQVANDSGLQTLLGVNDSIPVDVGECVCVGVQVVTKENSNFNIEEPGEGDQLIDEIGLVADVNEQSCRTTSCGVTGAFNCAQTNAAGDGIGSHGFDITNVGDIDVSQDLQYVLLDSPDQDDEATDLDPLPPGGTDFEAGESAFPVAGVIAYVPPPECDEVLGDPRDNWGGFSDSDLLTLPEDGDGTVRYDLIEGLTESRYTDIQGISSYSDLENAFDDGTSNPDPQIPSDAYLTHIDYSGYNLDAVETDDIATDDTSEFESRLLDSPDVPQCN